MIPGIDVSHHQGRIDWARVRAAGIRFAFAKATEGDGREGYGRKAYVDPTYYRNREGAARHGIIVGSFHFCRRSKDPDYRVDALREATHLTDTIGEVLDGELPPSMDLEWDKRTRGKRWTPSETVQWGSDFLDYTAKAVARTPIVYGGKSFWRFKMGRSLALARYPLWLAQPRGLTPVHMKDLEARKKLKINRPIEGWHPPHFWQHSHRGRVDGIKGPVDLNWFMGSSYALEDMAKKPCDVVPIRPGADVRPPPRIETPDDPLSAQFWVWARELFSTKPRRSA